jgi:hypothetical protein
MESIQKEPDPKVFNYLEFNALRKNGVSDGQIAKKYGFNQPATLYQKLRRDGFPVCEVCGDYSKETAHCEQPNDGRKRRARQGTGERIELPPAKEAIPLFREALDELREAIEQLEHRREYFQDGRFVVEAHVQGQAYDSGEWLEFKGALAGGGQQSPPEPLTSLIAVYVLAGLPLEPLLKTLNREPADVNLDQLDLNIEGKRTSKGHTPGLKSKARHVARLIRAGNLRGGANTLEFTADQQEAAWRSYRLEQQGLSRKDIEQKLRKEGFGHQDVAQLRNLGLLPPAL